MKNRLHTLDYLRGITALGILLFHYIQSVYGPYEPHSFLSRFGYYSVPIFYLLSGLTLFQVYYDKMQPSRGDILSYAKKRFFRIFPLLWVVTIIALILSARLDWGILFRNLTGTFGFFRWWEYYAVGVWSIGNELVFYTFFPLFVYLTKKRKAWMLILSIILFAIYLYFAFTKLPNCSPENYWPTYTNPLNHAFFFLCGFLIGKLFRYSTFTSLLSLLMIISGVLILIFYPVSGPRLNLVAGIPRLIFTVSCVLICIGFYKIRIGLPEFIHKPFALLGEASYSVYLLHPIVFSISSIGFSFLANLGIQFPLFVKLFAPIIATLILSYFSYMYFEKYFMKKAR